MGFSSNDALLAALTASGQLQPAFFQKASSNAAASVAGRWHEFFTATGIPAAGAFAGTTGAATQLNSATTGSLGVGANVSPDTKHALSAACWSPTATLVPAVAMLVDLLLTYPALSVNSPTALTNPVGLPRYTNGDGVLAFASVTTLLGAASPVLTLNSYTDDQNNASNTTGSLTAAANALSVSSLFGNQGQPFFNLAAGDRGMRSVQSYTVSAGTATGAAAITLCRPLGIVVPVLAANTATLVNLLAEYPAPAKIEDGGCLAWLTLAGGAMVAAASLQGFLNVGWD